MSTFIHGVRIDGWKPFGIDSGMDFLVGVKQRLEAYTRGPVLLGLVEIMSRSLPSPKHCQVVCLLNVLFIIVIVRFLHVSIKWTNDFWCIRERLD